MREESVINAAKGAVSELNARERLSLAQHKLKDSGANTYYSVPTTIGYNLGDDWSGVSFSGVGYEGSGIGNATGTFKGIDVTFTKTAATDINSPATWKLAGH
jgi:putative lipase involved disintegration of autophagic bodies